MGAVGHTAACHPGRGGGLLHAIAQPCRSRRARATTRGARVVPPRATARDHYRGWEFSKTRLTDTYDIEHFKRDRPKADIVAELRPDGALNFLGPHREVKGGEGVTLISFGPPREAETPAVEAAETPAETTEKA